MALLLPKELLGGLVGKWFFYNTPEFYNILQRIKLCRYMYRNTASLETMLPRLTSVTA